MPWDLMLWGSGAFTLGLVIQDIYNPGSWLRVWWRGWNRLVDHTDCASDQVGSNPRVHEAYSRLSYRREMRGAEIRVWGVSPYQNKPVLISHETGLRCVKGDQKRIVLATIAISDAAFTPRFGDANTSHHFNDKEMMRVEIEIKCGWRRQRVQIDMIVRPISVQARFEFIAEEDRPYRWAVP